MTQQEILIKTNIELSKEIDYKRSVLNKLNQDYQNLKKEVSSNDIIKEYNEKKEELKQIKFLIKRIADTEMWESFAHDYGLDKYGGIRYLREILGDKNEFKNKYIDNKK